MVISVSPRKSAANRKTDGFRIGNLKVNHIIKRYKLFVLQHALMADISSIQILKLAQTFYRSSRQFSESQIIYSQNTAWVDNQQSGDFV